MRLSNGKSVWLERVMAGHGSRLYAVAKPGGPRTQPLVRSLGRVVQGRGGRLYEAGRGGRLNGEFVIDPEGQLYLMTLDAARTSRMGQSYEFGHEEPREALGGFVEQTDPEDTEFVEAGEEQNVAFNYAPAADHDSPMFRPYR
jgi:hypothetical protein